MPKLLCRLPALLLAAAVLLTASACERNQIELDNETIRNFAAPDEGEEVAVLTIRDYGDICIKLFPDESPKGVENFKTLIQQGFYDELIFHRVVKDFVIQGGDPKGDGTGGKDAWGEKGFSQNISTKLRHFTGAVAYAVNEAEMLNNSQFYIVTGGEAGTELFDMLSKNFGRQFSGTAKQLYDTWGGQPYLDGGYEIFGQVYAGMDIALELQNVAVDSNDKPRSAIVIEKAEIVPYHDTGESPHWLNWKGEEPVQPE